NVYWNTRLFMLTGDGKYFDVIERILYNALIAGISLDGKSFFYVNPLECDGVFKFNSGSLTRQPWFDCSCCPTNLIRFIPAMPGLLYGVHDDTLFVNLYASNNAEVNVGNSVVRIEESSEYPWNGKTILKIIPSKKTRFTLKLRIPGWAQNQVLPGNLYSYTDTIQNKISISINGEEISYDIERGYAVISRAWNKNETIEMNIPMDIRRVVSNENVKSNENLVALERAPFVYCVEGIDNADRLNDILLSDDVVLKVEKKNELLDGINVLTGIVNVRSGEGTMELFAIPYYAWANRGITTMKVWLPLK
ncbi:MAG TPA: glycoside hydrolase family 127 protein, partial [Bacteroidota bacterium]|nr:glycoside hydrolase family 127 protein [Bacteroidota bacterium]